jgi:ketosteroid isomerase-like protein
VTATIDRERRTAAVVQFFETLKLVSLAGLDRVYTEDARFKDPFNDVQGMPAIRAVFEHMFATLIDPRFTVLDAVTEGDQAFLTWDFSFRRRRGGAALRIHGATHLRFAADGRVALHRDYWDAAEELYAKLPVLGALMRWLQKRLAVPA